MMRKFFFRRFIRYLIMLLVPTLLVFGIMFKITEQQIERELEQQAHTTLSTMDVNLNHVISTVIYQNEFFTSNISLQISLKKLLRDRNNVMYRDSIYLKNIDMILGSTVEAYPYLDSVYFYLDGYPYMMTSDSGLISCANYDDMVWQATYAEMEQEQKTSVIRRIIPKKIYKEAHWGFTIIEKMRLQNGAIVFNIDESKYMELMNDILTGRYESFFVLNENGEVILNRDSEELQKYNELDKDIFHQFMKENLEHLDRHDGKWVFIGNKKMLLNVMMNDQYKLYLVSFIDREARLAKYAQINSLFLLILLLDSMLILIVAYNITERNFKQIHYMINLFDEASRGIYPQERRIEMKDEYDIIMNNIIFMFLNNVQLNTELQEKKLDSERAKMNALQMQINPHFLYNTLQSVELLVKRLEGPGGSAGKALVSLSDILKYSIRDALSEVSLEEEIKYLKKYVDIQKYRFGDRFIIYYEIEEELYQMAVFRLMLQPLVENSILHGILQQMEKGYIKIKIHARQNRIVFHVIDSGHGMTADELMRLRKRIEDKSNSQIGVANVNSRLILRYGEESRLHISSKLHMGTWIRFSLPDIRRKD